MALVPKQHEFPLYDNRPELPPAPKVVIPPANQWPPPYHLEDGLRRVAPYHFTYNTFCKQRWRGREILDIFATEFRDRSQEYYQKAIEEGKIVLNGKPCHDVHTKVQNGDVISHTLHRHEPPVTAQPIRAIYEDDDMIVIDKPAGVPVHPAGRYRYNSVVEIMRAERSYTFNPLPCNRLDRLTSGVMFIGKTGKKAEDISQSLRERTVRKEYVARVKGRFPDGEEWDGNPMRGGVVKCEEAILQISPILGLNRARASGKSAKTLFRRIAYYPSKSQTDPTKSSSEEQEAPPTAARPPVSNTENEGYSIVHCLPLTGRTHQLRVHLQFLGHPISNDPIYSNRRVFGADLARNDNTAENDAKVVEELSKMGKTELADAYSYSSANKTKLSRDKANDDQVISTLVDQTQQITVSDLREATKGTVTGSATGPNSSPTARNTFKPLPQSLHAGPLPHSTLSQISNGSQETNGADPLYEAYIQAHDEAVQDYNKRKGEKLTGETCTICDTPLYSDPGPQELGIYLHALAYADLNGKWKYRSSMPEWAKPPKDYDGDDGPVEVSEWIYEGAGSEGLHIGDEKESEALKNDVAMKKNRELE